MAATSGGGVGKVLVQDFRPRDPRARWLPWNDLNDPLREHSWLPPDAMYVGRTIQELAGLIGPARSNRFTVLVTWFWTVDAVLPRAGDDVIVFCLGDESGRKPSYSHDVALVAKSNGVTRRPFLALGGPKNWPGLIPAAMQEARGQLRIAPGAVRSMMRTTRRRRRANLVEIPLGTFWLCPVPFVPLDERRYDLSFAGSMRNDAQERATILPQKVRSRIQMTSALKDMQELRPDLRASMTMLDVFSDVGNHRQGYSELMMQTRLALCPRGGARETYRVFEAAASGCIPITERLPRRDYYQGFPGVQLRTWSQLPSVVDALLADAGELRRRQEAVLRWWNAQATPCATAARIARKLG